MRNFVQGDIIQHFKRETVEKDGFEYLYEYIGEAIHSETREKMVVYRAMEIRDYTLDRMRCL